MNAAYAQIIVGLKYGDEGKGSIVDHLCKERGFHVVVRYNGGSQAAHNVVLRNGTHHRFSQFGSGAFRGAATLLSRYMMVDPFELGIESSYLSHKLGSAALTNHYIDERAPVITPFHVAANRLREWMRGANRHGSCGRGIGELAEDMDKFPHHVITAKEMKEPGILILKLASIRERKLAELAHQGLEPRNIPDHLCSDAALLMHPKQPALIGSAMFTAAKYFNIISPDDANRMMRNHRVIFEGAQGIALDESHGFHPHTTWSNTTQANALSLLAEASFSGPVEITGVLRAYETRHGAGPFVSYNKLLDGVSPNEHNGTGRWQGDFRCGHFDSVLTRYTASIANHIRPLNSIALTHMDIPKTGWPYCGAYRLPADEILQKMIPDFSRNQKIQSDRARLVMSANPNLSSMHSSPDEFIRHVENCCSAPVVWTSHGPRAEDKRLRYSEGALGSAA